MVRKLGLLLGMVLCVMYLLNPTAGLFEFIPDNIPGVGNIDEGAAGALLFYLFRKWRQRSGLPTDLDPTPAPRPSQPKVIVSLRARFDTWLKIANGCGSAYKQAI